MPVCQKGTGWNKIEIGMVGLVGCWSFTSLQHPSSYQDRYRPVTAYTYADCIMLSYWENQDAGTLTLYPTQSHYPNTDLTSSCLILLMPSAKLRRDKYQRQG